MANTLTATEQNLCLAAAYLKMNGEGRDVLDLVLRRLVKNKGHKNFSVISGSKAKKSQRAEHE